MEGEVCEVDAEDEGNGQVGLEESFKLHALQDAEAGFRRKEQETYLGQHDPSNQCDENRQNAAGPDVVCEHDGERATPVFATTCAPVKTVPHEMEIFI
ncbi:MAG: hypothetical protein DMG30_12365 [Acidobacteria bacterium]|nr:MAG: hypothetical protein DMG30_12365 [Acidobacteriota bacterium]